MDSGAESVYSQNADEDEYEDELFEEADLVLPVQRQPPQQRIVTRATRQQQAQQQQQSQNQVTSVAASGSARNSSKAAQARPSKANDVFIVHKADSKVNVS